MLIEIVIRKLGEECGCADKGKGLSLVYSLLSFFIPHASISRISLKFKNALASSISVSERGSSSRYKIIF